MNYTGGPSISGCRPVLPLYPTHHFCQYLLGIFITFTNSSLFCRAFSTNSRSPLSHAAGVTAPPEGEPLAGRFTFHWTPEVRQDARGWALLTGTAASGQRSLSSCRWPRQRSTAASETSCFARPDESWPTCQWLPLWGSWRAQARLRGQGCCQTALRSDSIALTKSLPIAAQRLFPAGLALSVTFGDTSPKGRGLGRPVHFLLDA